MGDWLAESIDEISDPYQKARFAAGYAVVKDPPKQWRVLTDVPKGIDTAYDNQGRQWEREGTDWVTYSSFVQRWSTAITDLSGWGPYITTRLT